MRILHTSDWHLGVSAEQAPREQEHVLFLDWLINELKVREVEVLVHGGDVFHHVQPSARSQKLYYRFLASCLALPKLKHIIITGGNHDSASRLDAPRDILQALNVRVVGGLFGDDDSWEQCLCPIHDEDGNLSMVVVAVPYIHESRLGVRTTGRNAVEVREEMVKQFQFVYTSLADEAERLYGDVPMITTGHLTCYPETKKEVVEGHYHTPLHQMENLGSLPPEIFDDRFCYIALGHIHKMFQIGESNAWYAGSPIPTDIVEAQTPCWVIQVDVTPDHLAQVELVQVPNWRPIYDLQGPPEDVLKEIEGLEWEEPLPPYLYIDFHVDAPMYDGMTKVTELLQAFEKKRRPRVIRMKETLTAVEEAHPVLEDFSRKPLIELAPGEVFEKMYTIKHGQPPPEHIVSAFSSLLGEEEAS